MFSGKGHSLVHSHSGELVGAYAYHLAKPLRPILFTVRQLDCCMIFCSAENSTVLCPVADRAVIPHRQGGTFAVTSPSMSCSSVSSFEQSYAKRDDLMVCQGHYCKNIPFSECRICTLYPSPDEQVKALCTNV